MQANATHTVPSPQIHPTLPKPPQKAKQKRHQQRISPSISQGQTLAGAPPAIQRPYGLASDIQPKAVQTSQALNLGSNVQLSAKKENNQAGLANTYQSYQPWTSLPGNPQMPLVSIPLQGYYLPGQFPIGTGNIVPQAQHTQSSQAPDQQPTQTAALHRLPATNLVLQVRPTSALNVYRALVHQEICC